MPGMSERQRAIGISIHTGWGACVVVGGSLARPEIVANEVIEILGDSERFCFHMAAEMKSSAARKWLTQLRRKAVRNARRGLAPLIAEDVAICAIIAKEGSGDDLDRIFASHARIHMAEGWFYRDAVRDACSVPVAIVPPASLEAGRVGKLAAPPWGRDQKLAALAAWTVMSSKAVESRP
jgi:hypothetical protein